MKETQINRKLLDQRVVERNIRKGLISDADYKAFLKKLPDEEPNAQWVQMDVHETELGEVSSGSLGGDSEEDA